MIYILWQIGFEVPREQGQDSGNLNWEVLTLSRALAVPLRGCTMRECTKLALTSSSSCCHVPQCRPSSTFRHVLQKPLTCQSLQDLLLSVHTHFTWLCNTGYWWERIEWEALDLKTQPFQTAHWKKVFKKYQKQWNHSLRPEIETSNFLAFESFSPFPWLLTQITVASEIWKHYSIVMPAFSLLFHYLCFSFHLHSSTGAPGNITALFTESSRRPIRKLMSLLFQV